MRAITIVTLFCLLASTYCQSHDLVLGTATYGDVVIYKVNECKYGFPLFVRTSEIEYPEPGQQNFAFIRAIYIKDNERDGTGGYPTIKAGGIGQRFVKIKLKSQRSNGFNFTVTIYGRYLYNMGLQEFEKWSNQPGLFSEKSRLCAKIRGLTPGQRRICRRHKDHMPVVSAGVKQGISECQYQFQGRRWNCTTTGDETVFGPLTLIASRETAFTHAITAAGASLYVSRACRDGRLSSCGCSRSNRPANLHEDWVWAGCGMDLEYGYRFTEGFIDIRERERKVKRGSREQGRQLMNRHNNEAGRRAVIKKSRVTCKCHGVSGSCSLITCWQQLASIREIGDFLRDKYEGATEVKVSRRGKLRLGDPRYSLPTAQDLVYLEESPNYCIKNESFGSLGTTGRECNRTSAGMDGCSLMCCGRGYNTRRVEVKERCGCKFHWCCTVHCNTCVKIVEVYTCK